MGFQDSAFVLAALMAHLGCMINDQIPQEKKQQKSEQTLLCNVSQSRTPHSRTCPSEQSLDERQVASVYVSFMLLQ